MVRPSPTPKICALAYVVCPGQDLRRSLASCSPVPALRPQIRKVVDKVLPSKAIDRARLFIKPTELSDGVARLALSELASAQGGSLKEKNIDVVKKSTLVRNKAASVCVRCGGHVRATVTCITTAHTSRTSLAMWHLFAGEHHR